MNTTAKKYTVQAIDFKLTRKLSSFARKHIEKLDMLSDRIVECRVQLRLERSAEPTDKVCEIALMMPGKDLFVSKKCQSFEESIATGVDALKHQLAHWKGINERKQQ